jgi:hypothetical protein
VGRDLHRDREILCLKVEGGDSARRKRKDHVDGGGAELGQLRKRCGKNV